MNRKPRLNRMLLFVLLMIIPMIISSTLAYAKPMTFTTHMSRELPGVETLGQGQSIFKVSADGNSVSFRIIVANISDITMAHIHISAAPGGNGPPAVWLYPASPPAMLIPGRTQGTLMAGTFTASDFVGPLAGMQISDLITAIMENRAYVNVHTSSYPGGEIRGNIK